MKTFTSINGQPIMGFTGTRKGMNDLQKEEVRKLLVKYLPNVIYHGDAIGADAEADAIAKELGIPRGAIPGVTAAGNYKDRAYCDTELVLDKKLPFLERNHLIVDISDIMIAAPAETSMTQRSGTWATVRYAIKTYTTMLVVLRTGLTVAMTIEGKKND